jgi:hypothetical protein
MDNDGVISYRDLHDALQLVLGKSCTLSPELMHTVVSKARSLSCHPDLVLCF